jgi:hypothetical protein
MNGSWSVTGLVWGKLDVEVVSFSQSISREIVEELVSRINTELAGISSGCRKLALWGAMKTICWIILEVEKSCDGCDAQLFVLSLWESVGGGWELSFCLDCFKSQLDVGCLVELVQNHVVVLNRGSSRDIFRSLVPYVFSDSSISAVGVYIVGDKQLLFARLSGFELQQLFSIIYLFPTLPKYPKRCGSWI